jgi:hypothetical protein
MNYDCNRFDKYVVSIEFVAQSTGAGVINATYRFADKFRIGAYLDDQAVQGSRFGAKFGTGGVQYVDITRNADVERANPVTTLYPPGYKACDERLVTGLFGVKAKGFLIDKIGDQLSIVGPVDFSRGGSGYNGFSFVPGMEMFNIAHGGSTNGLRPAGMAGVFFEPPPNHRLSLNGYVSQQAWATQTYASGIPSYRIGF